MMAGCGRLPLSTNIFNFLRPRSCLITACQHISTKIKRRVESNILPPAPKKPLSAFFKYLKEVRPLIKEEFPQLKHTEVVKIASERWATMDPEHKKEFHKRYDEEYKNYVKELFDYEKTITPEQKRMVKEELDKLEAYAEKLEFKQALRALGKPKRPPSGFFLFMNKLKGQKGQNVEVKEWSKIVAERWRSLDPAEKQKFINEASKLMEKYNEELKEWEQKMINEGQVGSVDKKAILNWAKVINKPKT